MTTAPSLADAARAAAAERVIAAADPAQETEVAILEPANILDRLAARRRPKIQLTPLHVNIPVTLDRALSRAMQEKGIEKTAIVVEALRPILERYL